MHIVAGRGAFAPQGGTFAVMAPSPARGRAGPRRYSARSGNSRSIGQCVLMNGDLITM